MPSRARPGDPLPHSGGRGQVEARPCRSQRHRQRDRRRIHGTRIRLHGIDAPESRQTCRQGGQQAALALADKIARRPVSCSPKDTDRYGRVVAVCRAGDEDLNAWLVSEGHAVAYRQYSRDYVALEDQARAAKRGIWAGEFMVPAEWRKANKGGR